jgi:hypothetical protein
MSPPDNARSSLCKFNGLAIPAVVKLGYIPGMGR